MYSSKSSKTLLLTLMLLFISLATPLLGCRHCGGPTHHPKHKTDPHSHPIKPPGTIPQVPLPPPITVPPVIPYPPTPSGKPCPPPPPPPPAEDTCPIDALKLGACVDILGGLIHIGLGDPIKNQCCPILQGLVDVEAAVCLCTTLKLKLLNLNLYVPLALQLFLTCGKPPPPGFTCSL